MAEGAAKQVVYPIMMGYLVDVHRFPRPWPPGRHLCNDHEPAHVHVSGDGEAKINLLGAGGSPELIWAQGMTRAEVRRAVRVVEGQQTLLLARRRDIHG